MLLEDERNIEDLRITFQNFGYSGSQALNLAQQKFIDLTNGIDLPYESYLPNDHAVTALSNKA